MPDYRTGGATGLATVAKRLLHERRVTTIRVIYEPARVLVTSIYIYIVYVCGNAFAFFKLLNGFV